MASAILTLSDGTYSVEVTLVYNYLSANTWSCAPGYLSSSSGTWDSSRLTHTVNLWDSHGKVLRMIVPQLRTSVGNPLPDLRGASGESVRGTTGGVLDSVVAWSF